MNLEIGTEAAHFSEKEFTNGIFLAVQLSVCILNKTIALDNQMQK